MGRTRYRKINIDTNTIVISLGFIAIAAIHFIDSKKQQKVKDSMQVELEEKNALYKQ